MLLKMMRLKMTLMLLLIMIFLLVARMGCETCNRFNLLPSEFKLYYIHYCVHHDCCCVSRMTCTANNVMNRSAKIIMITTMLMMQIM